MKLMKQVNIKTILFACLFLCCHNATYGVEFFVYPRFLDTFITVEINEEDTGHDLERKIMASVDKEYIGPLDLTQNGVRLEKDKKLSLDQLMSKGEIFRASLTSKRDMALFELKERIKNYSKKGEEILHFRKRIADLKKELNTLLTDPKLNDTYHQKSIKAYQRGIREYEDRIRAYDDDNYLKSAYDKFQRLNDEFLKEKEEAFAELERQLIEERRSLEEIREKALETSRKYSGIMRSSDGVSAGIHAPPVAASTSGGGSGAGAGSA
jgi:hypothetical protein